MSSLQGPRDPQPMSQGWEAPALIVAGVATVLGLAALIGLGVAGALFGGGWVWPEGAMSFPSNRGGFG